MYGVKEDKRLAKAIEAANGRAKMEDGFWDRCYEARIHSEDGLFGALAVDKGEPMDVDNYSLPELLKTGAARRAVKRYGTFCAKWGLPLGKPEFFLVRTEVA
jgi:hypothetical protein